MRAISVLLLATGILGITHSAMTLAQEEPGLYFGANFGFTRADTGTAADELRNDLLADGFTTANVTIDESDTGFKFLAGYQLNRNFAVEGYYANLGTYEFTMGTTGPAVSGSGEIEVTGFGVDAIGMFPFNRALSGFARVGLFRWEAEATFTATGPGGTATASDDDDGTDLKFGVGIQWAVGRNIRLRGEVEYYTFDDPITVLSAGVLFRF